MSTNENSPELSPVKRALLEVRELRERLERSERRHSEPIAIVGIGCRFPGGVRDAATFWDLLENGRDAITEIPQERWDVDAYYDANPDTPGKMSTRWGGFVEGLDRFDAEFFGIAAREAGSLDPQQRMLLETAWEALEDAGIDPGTLLGTPTGVFAGIAAFDYGQLQLQANDPTRIDAYFATGASHSVATGRISYVLGLKGPCLAVDTACSASLVAVHLACQSLRARECNLALAGGVNVLLLPELFVDFSNARMMAADGRCKSFDAAADGYVRSEGCGMIVLRRLSDALTAGDRILAVIRGSAINQDGRSSGLTAPNGPSQVAVIRSALENGGVSAANVGYVEAHGTGTSLGDPIEVQALATALGTERAGGEPLLIGTVKTNLGHLEAAAGIAGLIKAVLCLQRRAIPKSLHFRQPNPVVPWNRLPVRVATELTSWRSSTPRVAGVSSFGFSGTNAHVVVEEHVAPDSTPPPVDRPVHVVTVSARTEAALAANVARVASALELGTAGLGDFVYSQNTGRMHFGSRMAVVGGSREELVTRLRVGRADDAVGVYKGVVEARPSVCLLFAGQGSQHPGMSKSLFATLPSFRRHIEYCEAALEPVLPRRLTDILYGPDSAELLREPRFAQPAIVALEYALHELWRTWGVTPTVMLGHSLGEYAMAIAAGVLTPEDGLRLVAKRAELVQQRCPDGRMLAVRGALGAVREWIEEIGGTLNAAAVNAPDALVVSGSVADIDRLAAALGKRGVRHQALETTRAFHNALLAPMLAELDSFARTLPHAPPAVPLLSNVTGRFFADGTGPDASYWSRQARQPVLFLDALRAAHGHGIDTFLEIGPSATLTGLAEETFAGAKHTFASLRRDRDDWSQLGGAVAGLYTAGAPIDWRAFEADYARRKVVVPTYAFQRKRYWFEEGGTLASVAAPRSEGAADQAARWDRAVKAGRRQAQHVPIDLDLPSYGQRWACLDALTAEYIIRTLRELGCFAAGGESRSLAEIAHEAALLPMYHTLLERWLERLVAKDLLERRGERFHAKAPLRAPRIEPTLASAYDAFADAPFIVDYLAGCGDQLTAIVLGKQSPLETLFPNGSRQTAVDLYRNWSLSRYFNDIAAAVVAAIAAQVPHDRTLQLLEIGGGTGGTTSAVLPELPPRRTAYRFTDVSPFFFAAAAEDFAAYPFVEYSVLDIERNPEEQGYGRQAFHAVIAANVLHATRDLARTMDHVLSLLKPGGALVLYEVTDPKSWIDTSVALIAGWAKSSDGLRDNGPLLSADTWRELLAARGFDEVVVFPGRDSRAEVLGMSVIVARAPLGAAAAIMPTRGQSSMSAIATPDSRSETPKVRTVLADALPDERIDVLVKFVREHVGAVVGRDAAQESIGRQQSLMELGLDSLMAIQLRNRLTTGLELARQLPATLIFDYPNIGEIARFLLELLAADTPARVTDSLQPVPPAESLRRVRERDLGSRSDEEIEAMLLKKLEGRKT